MEENASIAGDEAKRGQDEETGLRALTHPAQAYNVESMHVAVRCVGLVGMTM